MESMPAESDPFSGIEADPHHRAPKPRSAVELLGGILGFLIMGAGGIVIVIGALFNERIDAYLNLENGGEIIVGAGCAICAAGYALFNWRRSLKRGKWRH